MPRRIDFNEDGALEAAMLLFWEKGYEATSMQALEQAMELNRTSIYNTFGNKRSLFQQALQRYLAVVLHKFITVLEESVSAKEAMKGVLYEVIHLHFCKANPGGCMVVLSLLESNQHDKNTNAMLDSALKQLNEAIIKRLQQGVEDGDLPGNFDCRIVGSEITALITGMIVMAKANFQKDPMACGFMSPENAKLVTPGNI